MKLPSNDLFSISVILALLLMLQACAGSGEMSKTSGSVQEYSKDYNSMTKLVERAITGSNLNIDFVQESDNKSKMTLTVSRDRYVGNEEVQQEQGEVRIIKLNDNKTRVEVDNPDYHFSVSEHEREDYQRIIFMRIKSLLDKNKS